MLPSLQEVDDDTGNAVLTPRKSRERDLKDWKAYWDRYKDIDIPERGAVFRVYEAGATENFPHILLIHGGGYTALTWSILVSKLKHRFRLTALDMRGHGQTHTDNDDDLSAQTLVEDVCTVWNRIRSLDEEGRSGSVVLVGHSMGASIAIRVASTEQISSLEGVVVIDVVEGTALASLPYMKNIINKRPPSFTSVQDAIDWALSTKMCKNKAAACVSIPSMLKELSGEWTWRTDLLKSEPYWQEWYEGLSQLFLSLHPPKLLCLAGTDRLDKTLTVGQMQGKFQLSLMPTAGHAIHEDDADHVAELLLQFIEKFRIGQAPLPFLRNNKS